ncbi:hypothetical protein ACWD5Q_06510 [Streptomyces sp. NPDC002513]
MTFAPRTWVVGEVVSAAIMNQEIRDQLNSFFGAWTVYTPAWTASTTNPVIGNGTITGRYMKVGRTVYCHINVTAGSTTTFGSGNYSFSLPFAAANNNVFMIGNAEVLGSSRWAGHAVIGTGATTTSVFMSTSSTNSTLSWMTPAVPETLASGAQIRITLMYESAT